MPEKIVYIGSRRIRRSDRKLTKSVCLGWSRYRIQFSGHIAISLLALKFYCINIPVRFLYTYWWTSKIQLCANCHTPVAESFGTRILLQYICVSLMQSPLWSSLCIIKLGWFVHSLSWNVHVRSDVYEQAFNYVVVVETVSLSWCLCHCRLPLKGALDARTLCMILVYQQKVLGALSLNNEPEYRHPKRLSRSLHMVWWCCCWKVCT